MDLEWTFTRKEWQDNLTHQEVVKDLQKKSETDNMFVLYALNDIHYPKSQIKAEIIEEAR